jgi:hypothetical protein
MYTPIQKFSNNSKINRIQSPTIASTPIITRIFFNPQGIFAAAASSSSSSSSLLLLGHGATSVYGRGRDPLKH